MKRWVSGAGNHMENKRIDRFIKDIIDVCYRHGLSISHEDGGGCFKICEANSGDIEWLQCAYDYTDDWKNGKLK